MKRATITFTVFKTATLLHREIAEFKVVGKLSRKAAKEYAAEYLGISEADFELYGPFRTENIRYEISEEEIVKNGNPI